MEKSVSHLISIQDSNISPRAVGPRVDIGRGLIWCVIHISPHLLHVNARLSSGTENNKQTTRNKILYYTSVKMFPI